MNQHTNPEPPQDAPQDDDDSFEWAIAEIFGHRRHAGRAREEERFGSKMLRIDIPVDGDPAKGWKTHFYGGGSIFSFMLTDRETVMTMNRPYVPAGRYTLAAPADDENEASDADMEADASELRW